MSEPLRYLERGEGDLANELLRSARDDGPSQASWQRALGAVALATGATSIAGSASAGGGLSLVAFAKWLAIGALVGGVGALGAGAAFDRLEQASKPRSVAVEAPPSPTTQPAPVEPSPPSPPATPPVVASAPAAASAGLSAVQAALAASASEAPTSPGDSLAAELGRIDAARRRLGSGDARGALAELDAYAKDYPRARFGEEAALLRAEALVALGDCAAARAVARGHEGAASVLGRRWAKIRDRCP